MAGIKFNDNGQGYIDFEWLLNLTSVEFVEWIQEDISLFMDENAQYHVLVHDENNPKLRAVTVIMKATYDVVVIHQFECSNFGQSTRQFLNGEQLRFLSGDING